MQQRYCVFTTDYIKLRMRTRLRIENVSDSPLKIERVILPGVYLISRSTEELGNGDYAPGSVIPERISGVDSHGFDSEYIPDRKSVASRGYLEITVKDPWIMVSIDGSGQKGGQPPGAISCRSQYW